MCLHLSLAAKEQLSLDYFMQHSTLHRKEPAPSPQARTGASSSVSSQGSSISDSFGRVQLTEEEIDVINVSMNSITAVCGWCVCFLN